MAGKGNEDGEGPGVREFRVRNAASRGGRR